MGPVTASRVCRAASGIPGSRVGALVTVVLLAIPVGAAAQFAVYPVSLELEATSGVAARNVTVENQGSETLEVRVYAGDYDRAPTGDHRYFRFGEHERTCAGRLETFPDQLALAPGERGEIRIRMQPDSAVCWGVVFVEKRTVAPTGLTMAQRIGVKVLAEPAGLPREGRVLGVAADTTSEPAALVAFENQGRAVLDITGEVEVRDMTGEVVGVVEAEPFQVLPGRQRRIRVPLEGAALEPGRYLLVAVLDLGADYLAGGQAVLEVPRP